MKQKQEEPPAKPRGIFDSDPLPEEKPIPPWQLIMVMIVCFTIFCLLLIFNFRCSSENADYTPAVLCRECLPLPHPVNLAIGEIPLMEELRLSQDNATNLPPNTDQCVLRRGSVISIVAIQEPDGFFVENLTAGDFPYCPRGLIFTMLRRNWQDNEKIFNGMD